MRKNTLITLGLFSFSMLQTPAHVQGATSTPPSVATPSAQPLDRKEGAGASGALAAVGAGIAALSCLQLSKAAKELELTDPAKAAELRAMASLQCAQAAQSAGNAAQNNESRDALSRAESPQSNPVAEPPSPNNAAPASAPTSVNMPQLANAESDAEPDTQVFEADPPEATVASLQVSKPPQSPVSALQPAETSKVDFDESSKGSNTTPATSNAGLLTSLGTSLLSSQNGSLPALTTLGKSSENEVGKKKALLEENAAAYSDSDTGSSSTPGDPSAALARLMGGTTEAQSESMLGGSQEVVVGAGAPGKAPNIFQYATYRVKKARKEGILKQAPSAAGLPSRGLAGVRS